ncbi:MAG: hypothetical protein QHD01_31920 [Bradyrhizobium sp.]|uniref:hypothetical protein n=1 Tax=Bradyrhizobium sp. TaxID=376 RepID=UPI0029AC7C60|nr:hypothetical protein [Bradyrhizobium sp.]MDX3971178.1 hypothetical protein [Bradyrhizobium sp.]
MTFVAPRDRVLEQSTSNSQSVFAVTGALDLSYDAFNASMSVGDTTFGAVVEPGVAFKSGLLTYSATNEVTVSVVHESKGTFSAGGTKQVFMGWPAAAAVVAPVYGQCKLVKSGSNLVLLPFNGNQLTIDGRPRTIPAGGVSLAPTGLTPGANLYIYATASGPDVNALEAVATGHATSTAPGQMGMEVKTGDDTRTLVGFARIIAGPAFADSATQRFVYSWFNPETLVLTGATDASSTETGTSSYAEKTPSKIEFLCRATDAVHVAATGVITNAASASAVGISVMIDGVAVGIPHDVNVSSASFRCPVGPIVNTKLSEMYHYADFGMRANGGGTASATYGITTTARIG